MRIGGCFNHLRLGWETQQERFGVGVALLGADGRLQQLERTLRRPPALGVAVRRVALASTDARQRHRTGQDIFDRLDGGFVAPALERAGRQPGRTTDLKATRPLTLANRVGELCGLPGRRSEARKHSGGRPSLRVKSLVLVEQRP